MIENFSKKKNSFFIKLLVIIIILSLILTGIMISNFSNNTDKVAEVNGEKITGEQLKLAFQQEKQLLQEYLGDKFSEIASNKKNMNILRDQVLNNLINNELISQYANLLKFYVSDKKIEQTIFSMPIFFKNGKFNNEKYHEILNKYNIEANNFAEQIRKNLIRVQLIKSFAGTDFSLPSEVKTYAELFTQEREISTAVLPLFETQTKQTASESEIKNYFYKNYNNFLSPEQVKVNYMEIDVSSINVDKISNEDAMNFYKKNINNYTSPEKKEYSLIQVSSKEEANDIINSLKNGMEFSKLANEKSTDKFTANNNGIIGWMDTDSTPNEIISANLIKKGQISNPIQLNGNYVIFCLNDIKPKEIKSFFDVKELIKDTLIQDKKVKEFSKLQKKINELIKNTSTSLLDIESISGLKFKTTDWFNQNNPPVELNFLKVINDIFNNVSTAKKNLKNLKFNTINVDNNKKMFVIRIVGYKPEYMQKFEKVKKEILNLVKREKANIELKKEGDKILAELKDGDEEKVLKKSNIIFTDKRYVSRLIPQNTVVDAAMKMTPPVNGNPSYCIAHDEFENLVIIKLSKIILGQPSDYELKELFDEYKNAISSSVNDILIENLRKNAKIKIFI